MLIPGLRSHLRFLSSCVVGFDGFVVVDSASCFLLSLQGPSSLKIWIPVWATMLRIEEVTEGLEKASQLEGKNDTQSFGVTWPSAYRYTQRLAFYSDSSVS